jgi:hypothetical protein
LQLFCSKVLEGSLFSFFRFFPIVFLLPSDQISSWVTPFSQGLAIDCSRNDILRYVDACCSLDNIKHASSFQNPDVRGKQNNILIPNLHDQTASKGIHYSSFAHLLLRKCEAMM